MTTKDDRRIRRLAALISALLFICLSATAIGASMSGADADHLLEQRQAFVEAERALKRGDRRRYEALLNDLHDYPLYPYLLYTELRQRIARADSDEINDFLDTHADTPLAPRLRRAWLKDAYRKKRWEEVIQAYQPTTNAAMQCRYLHALHETGEVEKALEQVPKLWLASYSQPPACDPIFAAWRSAERLTSTLAWARIRLAMKAGRTGLARYLSRYLPENERYLVDLWRRVRNHPSTVLKHRLFRNEHPIVNEILVYGVARWARRAPDKAAQAWGDLQPRYAFSDDQVAAVQRAIGLRYARRDDGEALRWLESVDERWADDRLREVGAITALRDRQWEQALDWIDRLEAAGQGEPRWRYWRARSLTELGEGRAAMQILSELAGQRSFYGFMAADHADLPYSLNESPLPIAESEIDDAGWIPGVRRAREFFLLGRTVDARREWHHTTRYMAPRQLAAAAALAHRWGWHDRAILTLGRTGHLDDLELRFPLAFHEPVVRQAQQQAIDPAWVFAVMRQESAFSPDAHSPAGAMGLMQLLPRTARQVARKTNTRYRSHRQLYNADLNIRLGSAYLRRLLDQLDEHPALATAAYNAGPHRVKKWLPENSDMPSDVWIESVPFRETRNYLKRVFAYTAIYEQRLGQEPTRLTKRLAPVPSRLGEAAKPGSG